MSSMLLKARRLNEVKLSAPRSNSIAYGVICGLSLHMLTVVYAELTVLECTRYRVVTENFENASMAWTMSKKDSTVEPSKINNHK